MTNLDVMKKTLVDQIMGMDAIEFHHLLEIFYGNYSDEGIDSIDTSDMFECDACRQKYGDCEEGDRPNLCDIRFAESEGMEIQWSSCVMKNKIFVGMEQVLREACFCLGKMDFCLAYL